MLLNLALLFLVFGAEKKKIGPYYAALLVGVLKAVIYVVISWHVLDAAIMGLIYAGLSSAFVYFLKRVNARDYAERDEVPVYRAPGSQKLKFKWEYIPLVVLLFLLVGGEIFLTQSRAEKTAEPAATAQRP